MTVDGATSATGVASAGGATPGTGVAFADVQAALTLFAEAIAGRALALAPLGDETAPIAFDGDTIHLPTTVDHFGSRAHNRGAYRVMVLHQVGYLVFGSFAYEDPEPSPAPAFPWAGPKGSALDRLLDRSPHPALLRRVFGTVEDLRVDAALRRHFPGARADLARVLAHALAARPPAIGVPGEPAVVDALVRFSLGDTADALARPGADRRIGAVLALAATVDRSGASVHDSVAAAQAIVALLRPEVPVAAADDDGPESYVEPLDAAELADLVGEGAQDSTQPAAWVLEDMDGEAMPSEIDLGTGAVSFRGELRTDLVYRQAQAAGGTLHDDAEGATVEAAGDGDGDGERDPDAGRPTARLATRGGTADRSADRTYLYDEWDHRAGRYVRAWCRLHEHRLRGDDVDFIAEVRRRYAVLGSQVRRRFSHLRPEAWQRVHRTSDGDELEIDALIEAVVDRRAGHTTDERLYMRRDRARREVATAFLVDLSASTGSPVVDPNAPKPMPDVHPDRVEYPYLGGGDWDEQPRPEPPRRAIDIAKEALALMGDAVHVLGDRHAIYGFSGMGHDKVEFYVAKEFDDEPSPRTWAALAAMEPRRYTRMGPAIRHATMKLAHQSVRTKLLIVVSDGYPQDSDYGPDPGDKEYGLQDTARALQEAETAGVSTYNVTIDPAGNDYLRRMCPPHRYSVIDDVHELPFELTKLYRALTTGSGRPSGR